MDGIANFSFISYGDLTPFASLLLIDLVCVLALIFTRSLSLIQCVGCSNKRISNLQ